MNLVSYLMAISSLILLMSQAVAFHKQTVCRQDAWLKSTELKTRLLLMNPPLEEKTFLFSCKINVVRNKDEIFWNKFLSLTKHRFILDIKGVL